MRKIIALIAALALCLNGCHSMINDGDRGLTVYASFYPIYLFLHGVTESAPKLRVDCLVQPLYGCPRSYTLSDWDAAKLSQADAVFVGGRGLESFASQLQGSSLAVVEVMQTMTLLGEDESVPEGDDEASHFTGANPWAWLSVAGAKEICENITAAMIQLDPQYADIYSNNLARLSSRLDALKADMKALMPENKPDVAVMQEGLVYLANELGLSVKLTIERESGEDMDEKSALKAVEDMKSAGIKIALIEKQAPARLIKYLTEEGITPVMIDTVNSRSDIDGYIGVMLENARAVAGAI